MTGHASTVQRSALYSEALVKNRVPLCPGLSGGLSEALKSVQQKTLAASALLWGLPRKVSRHLCIP